MSNPILKDQCSSQGLQVLTTYYLKLELANCENVLLEPKVEADSLISVKEQVEEEGHNVTGMEPANCEDVIIGPKVEADNLISVKEEVEEEGHNLTDLEPANYEDVLVDPNVEPYSLISVKEEVEEEGHNVTENLHMGYTPAEKAKNYPHYFDPMQSKQEDKSFNINEEGKSIYLKSETKKKKGTFVPHKEIFVDASVDIKPENKLEKAIANVVLNEQKIAKQFYSEYTQKKYVNDVKTSVIKTDIFFQCNECGKRFSTKGILTNHVLSCIKTAESSLGDSQLTKEDTLKSLLLEKPLLLEMFRCDICTFKTYNKRSIETHSKMHSVTKVYSCNICEYKSAYKSHLQNHMSIHTGEKPFSCNICEYRCALKGNLSKHMKKHTGEKPFPCNICKYRFSQKHGLLRHMRKHTGEEPFACNICEYRCAQKEHLKKHFSKHTGVKPFNCDICNYGCFRKTHLNRHMRTHTGEKPFSCNICEYKCAVMRNLKLHLNTHRHYSKTKLISINS